MYKILSKFVDECRRYSMFVVANKQLYALWLSYVEKTDIKAMAKDAKNVDGQHPALCTKRMKECEDRLILLSGNAEAQPTS